MRFLIVFFFSFLLSAMANAYDLDKIRLSFIEAINNKEKAQEFFTELNSIKKNDPIIIAYRGSASAILGKHAWNPISKLSYLKEGCETLDKAVTMDAENIEIRFLRFSLEHYVPSFLGFSKHLTIDKAKIIQLIQNHSSNNLKIEESIKQNIIQFLLESKRCTANEVQTLKKLSNNG